MVYQTLEEFLLSPFGSGKPMVDSKLDAEMNHMRLRVEGFTIIEKSYYIHIKIPSSSQDGVFYDVIIRFFTDSKQVEKEISLQNYKIQFFSNSPSFMYRYAVLYRMHGYLIEYLYNKMDPNFIDTLPEKTNAKMELTYDKSIYIACKFLSQHKFRLLTKLGVITQRKKSPEKFFQAVASFGSMKLDSEMRASERRISKKMEEDRKKTSSQKSRMMSNTSNTIKSASNSTRKPDGLGITRKVASSSTDKNKYITVKRGTKKRPTRSTKR